MSTSSTIADSSAPSAKHTIIRVGLIGVGNWALNGPVRVLSLMPQYEMAAVYSQRRDAAQSAADTFGIRHVVGSIDELVRHPDVDIVLVLTTGPQHEEAGTRSDRCGEDRVLRVALDAGLEDLG